MQVLQDALRPEKEEQSLPRGPAPKTMALSEQWNSELWSLSGRDLEGVICKVAAEAQPCGRSP